MKIGIGVITTQSRELHPNLLNLISMPTTTHVYVDKERRGPAYGRNQCIKVLYDAGCDFIALFDDDTYPIMSGWQDHMAAVMTQNNVDVMGYPDPTVAKKVHSADGMDYWAFCTGCFTMISRKAVEKLGYYSSGYRTYGYEDIGYLARARDLALTGPRTADASPTRVAEFIRSEDIYGSDREFDPFANMSAEDKTASIQENRQHFEYEVWKGPLYHPFSGSDPTGLFDDSV